MPSKTEREAQIARGRLKDLAHDEQALASERLDALAQLYPNGEFSVRAAALRASILRAEETGKKFEGVQPTIAAPPCRPDDLHEQGKEKLPYSNLSEKESRELEKLMRLAGFQPPRRPSLVAAVAVAVEDDPELEALLAHCKAEKLGPTPELAAPEPEATDAPLPAA